VSEPTKRCSQTRRYRVSPGRGEEGAEAICFLSDCWSCRVKALAWGAREEQEKKEIDDGGS